MFQLLTLAVLELLINLVLEVDNNLHVDGVTEIKLNDGGANVRIEADGIEDAYTLVSGSGDDLIDFRSSLQQLNPGEDYVSLSYQDHESVRLTIADMVQADGNGGFTLTEHIVGDESAGDRVTGAVIDEIILSNGSDIVNVEGSAFGAGEQQVLRPGYADYTQSMGDMRMRSHVKIAMMAIHIHLLIFKMLKLLGLKMELNTTSSRWHGHAGRLLLLRFG